MAVRILHTADWHVGRSIARHSRLDEHRAVLGEIVEAAARLRPDVAVVAGDVFEQHNPSPDAERVAFRALADLAQAAGRVVVVAGNHDSPRRFQALAPLAEAARVTVIGDLSRSLGDLTVEVEGAGGGRVQLVCLPWVPEHRFLRGELVVAKSGPEDTYADRMEALIGLVLDETRREGVPQVLVGHLFVSDSLLGGGERDLTVGQTYAVPGQAIPPSVPYAALGHVHRGQQAPGAASAWYAGSPLALDFGEHSDRKGILLAEVGPGIAGVSRVPLERGRPLVRIAGTLEELLRMAAEDRAPAGWIEVTVRTDAPHPALGDRVREAFPDCVKVRLEVPERDRPPRRASLAGLSPRQMFARYLAEREDMADPDAALLDRFDRLLGGDGGAGEDGP